jgi:hypothetical protein
MKDKSVNTHLNYQRETEQLAKLSSEVRNYLENYNNSADRKKMMFDSLIVDEEKRVITFVEVKNNRLNRFELEIEKWFKSEQYRKRLYDFKRLSKSLTNKRQSISIELQDLTRLNTLENTLSTLISAVELLSENPEQKLEEEFKLLEAQFKSELTKDEASVLNASGIFLKVAEPSLLYIISRIIDYKLHCLIVKIKSLLHRDLRQWFRTIIKFHFKNLNDEGDLNDRKIVNRNFFTGSFKLFCSWIIKKEYYNSNIFSIQ